jgi:vacuolar-type H+-ATPase subunit E/Vma4
MNLNIEQKINLSKSTNEARLKRMNARNECIEDLRKAAKENLINVFRKSPEYKKTLKNLIVQVSRAITLIHEGHDQAFGSRTRAEGAQR